MRIFLWVAARAKARGAGRAPSWLVETGRGNRMRPVRCLGYAVLAVAGVVACVPAYAQMNATGGADQAMMAGMDRMNRDMSAAPMTGDADHDFAAMMVPHHQGAIDMAKAELRYGKDPELRRLANAIIASQVREVALMKHWLETHQ